MNHSISAVDGAAKDGNDDDDDAVVVVEAAVVDRADDNYDRTTSLATDVKVGGFVDNFAAAKVEKEGAAPVDADDAPLWEVHMTALGFLLLH